MKLILAASCLAIAHSFTTGDELKAIRDDIRGVCYKLYGKDDGPKKCRPVADADSQRHVHMHCNKSGWSGQGKLQCNYGFDMYGQNMQGGGDRAVAPGVPADADGRRRLQGDAAGMGSGLSEEERLIEEEDPSAGNVLHSVSFKFDNFEHVEGINRLGNYKFTESLCILQDITVYEDENVDPNCGVFKDEDGYWSMKLTAASCAAFCTPRYSSSYSF